MNTYLSLNRIRSVRHKVESTTNSIGWTSSRPIFPLLLCTEIYLENVKKCLKNITNCKRYSDFKTIYLHYHAGGKVLPVLYLFLLFELKNEL